jgi:hypothetical protein
VKHQYWSAYSSDARVYVCSYGHDDQRELTLCMCVGSRSLLALMQGTRYCKPAVASGQPSCPGASGTATGSDRSAPGHGPKSSRSQDESSWNTDSVALSLQRDVIGRCFADREASSPHTSPAQLSVEGPLSLSASASWLHCCTSTKRALQPLPRLPLQTQPPTADRMDVAAPPSTCAASGELSCVPAACSITSAPTVAVQLEQHAAHASRLVGAAVAQPQTMLAEPSDAGAAVSHSALCAASEAFAAARGHRRVMHECVSAPTPC